MIETPRAISDAQWAFIRNTPSSRNNTNNGVRAKIDVTPSEWDTGSSTCLYTLTSLSHPTVGGSGARQQPGRDRVTGGKLVCSYLPAGRDEQPAGERIAVVAESSSSVP